MALRKAFLSSYPVDVLPALVLACLLVLSGCGTPPEKQDAGGSYLIVVAEAARETLQAFAAYKQSQGFQVSTVTVEEIIAASSGRDGPEKIRSYLNDFRSKVTGTAFVLLAGSPETVPMRFASPDPYDQGLTIPTDLYYEYLSADWDADADGYYGEYGDDLRMDHCTYRSDLLVGRIPWDDPEQIRAICATMIRYQEPDRLRPRRALCAGQNMFTDCDGPLMAKLVQQFILTPAGFSTALLTSDNCCAVQSDDSLTNDAFLTRWEQDEPVFVTWFSHGNFKGMPFLNIKRIPAVAQPALAASVSCSVAAPDQDSLARLLMRDGACAAFLGAARDVFFPSHPVPLLLSGFRAALSLLWAREPIAVAKADFIHHYAGCESVPGNLSGPCFHQNLFLLIVYGDPSIRVR